VLLLNTMQMLSNVPREVAGTQDAIFVFDITANAFEVRNAWTRHFKFSPFAELAHFSATLKALPERTALVCDPSSNPTATNLAQCMYKYCAPAPTA
jgi:hypothetical protein